MRKIKNLLAIPLMMLASCASYQATTLGMLSNQESEGVVEHKDVQMSWRVFNTKDSNKYLGRDIISQGYVPVQVMVRNNSSDPVYLSPSNCNIVLPSPHEVARKVHTSTTLRVLGWGIPGIAVWPLLIPAVYDGIQSKDANKALDQDYLAKAVKEGTIQPHSSANGVVFVPKEQASKPLEMILVNQKTNEKLVFSFQKNEGETLR